MVGFVRLSLKEITADKSEDRNASECGTPVHEVQRADIFHRVAAGAMFLWFFGSSAADQFAGSVLSKNSSV
jgi:hypothetical protein